MPANTVLNYLPRKSVVHALTGTTKLVFFLLFTFASMITYDTRVLVGLMLISFAIFRVSRIRVREVRFMLIFMLVFLLLNNFFIFLFNPDQGTAIYGTRHVLLRLFWRYDVTAEQLFYMLNISLKYFVSLPVAILFISATDPSEFAASLSSIGVSYTCATPCPSPCATSPIFSAITTTSARRSRPAALSWAKRKSCSAA